MSSRDEKQVLFPTEAAYMDRTIQYPGHETSALLTLSGKRAQHQSKSQAKLPTLCKNHCHTLLAPHTTHGAHQKVGRSTCLACSIHHLPQILVFVEARFDGAIHLLG
jgi:hypothetical protein